MRKKVRIVFTARSGEHLMRFRILKNKTFSQPSLLFHAKVIPRLVEHLGASKTVFARKIHFYGHQTGERNILYRNSAPIGRHAPLGAKSDGPRDNTTFGFVVLWKSHFAWICFGIFSKLQNIVIFNDFSE